MNSAIKKWAAVGLLLLSPGSSFGNGGELGNGRDVGFVSRVIAVELQHPDSWKYFDLSSTVSFSGRDSVGLVLALEEFESIRTADDLLRALKQLNSGRVWKEAQVAGKPAWEAETAEGKIAYVLRDPGNVLSIRMRASDDQAERELVRVVKTIQFIR